VVFFDDVVLPLPSLELWVSVVLNVPGGGGTTTGAVVDVVDVVSDVVVCAKAPPLISNKMHAAVVRCFFIAISIHLTNDISALVALKI
jgi:hypothetical protein